MAKISARIKWTAPDGTFYLIDDMFIASWQFELVDRGGCGTFDVTLVAEIDDEFLDVRPGVNWMVEFFFLIDDVERYAYRGWIDKNKNGVQNGSPAWQITGSGLLGRVQQILADSVYVKPEKPDISDAFAWLYNKLRTPGHLPELKATFETTGYLIERADFTGADMQSAFNQLTDNAGDTIVWGFFPRQSDGADVLYVRKKAKIVLREDYNFWIGQHVDYFTQEDDLSKVLNLIHIKGGKSKAPNLAPNPSWEQPVQAGVNLTTGEAGVSGNLIDNTDASFEATTNGGFGGWTKIDDASVRGDDPNAGEKGMFDAHAAEMDEEGEGFYRTVTLDSVGANDYTLSYYYKSESATDPGGRQFTVTLDFYAADGTTVSEAPKTFVQSVTSPSYLPNNYKFSTTDPDTAKVKITFQSTTTTISDKTIHAMQVDGVSLVRSDKLGQTGWVQTGGTATINWAAADNDRPAYHGGYFVEADSVVVGTEIKSSSNSWLSGQALHPYRMRVWARTPAVQTFDLYFEYQTSDGKIHLSTVADAGFITHVTTPADDEWHPYTVDFNTPKEVQQFRPVIKLTSTGIIDFDAMDVYETGIETEEDNRENFLYGDQLVYKNIRSDNLGSIILLTQSETPNGLTPEAMESIELYGQREAYIENSLVTDLDLAKQFATAFLNKNSIVPKKTQLNIEQIETFVSFVDDSDSTAVQGMIGVKGFRLEDIVIDQNASRITYSLTKDGGIRCEMELSNRKPDPASLLTQFGQLSAGANVIPDATPLQQLGEIETGGVSPYTLVLGASDSDTSNGVNVLCDGTADEVEINTALTALHSRGGGVLALREGLYVLAGPIIIPGGNITILGNPNATVLQRNFDDGDAGMIQANGAYSHLLLQGLTLDGKNADFFGTGIYFAGVTDARVENCRLYDHSFNGIWVDGSSDPCHQIAVTDNQVEGGDTFGIMVEGADECIVHRNRTDGTGSDGINILNCADPSVVGNIALNSQNDNGIEIYKVEGGVVCGNVCKGNDWAGILITASDIDVGDNDCSDNGKFGIMVQSIGAELDLGGNRYGSERIHIHDCRIQNNGASTFQTSAEDGEYPNAGIAIYGGHTGGVEAVRETRKVTVQDCYISDTVDGWYGIRVDDSTLTYLIHNRFDNNSGGEIEDLGTDTLIVPIDGGGGGGGIDPATVHASDLLTRFEPLTTGGTSPALVFSGGDVVMAEVLN